MYVKNVSLDNKFIKLIELGNTWQGEGPDSGRQMILARFKKCNRNCPFCDTGVKMRSAQEGFFSINDINKALLKTGGILITGGEPTYDENFELTSIMISNCKYEVCNVETNGCDLVSLVEKVKSHKNVKFLYSPKLFNDSDYQEAMSLMDLVLKDNRIFLKVVVTTSELIDKYISEISKRCDSKSRIYLMAQGITKEEITSNWDRMIEMADKYNCNISSRLHIVHGFI